MLLSPPVPGSTTVPPPVLPPVPGSSGTTTLPPPPVHTCVECVPHHVSEQDEQRCMLQMDVFGQTATVPPPPVPGSSGTITLPPPPSPEPPPIPGSITDPPPVHTCVECVPHHVAEQTPQRRTLQFAVFGQTATVPPSPVPGSLHIWEPCTAHQVVRHLAQVCLLQSIRSGHTISHRCPP